MSPSDTRLVLIPGMGADARLFGPQRRAFPRLEVLPWLDPEPAETLASYGRRLAATLDTDEPFFLGGASLGGMLALEVARHVSPRAVFLIGSCRSGRAIPAHLRLLEWASRPLPNCLIGAGRRLTPLTARLLHGLRGEQRDLVVAMALATPIPFIRWASRALFAWSFEGELACPVHHIHGARDRLIPARRVAADHMVAGAGHLLNLTHADAVNAFLTQHVRVAQKKAAP